MRALGQNDRATPMGELESFLEKGAGFGALVGATERGSQLRERLGPLELRLRRGEHVDRLAEELETLVAALDEPGGAQRDAEGTRGSPAASKLDLLPDEPAGLLTIAQAEHRERRLGAPRRVARVVDPEGFDASRLPRGDRRVLAPRPRRRCEARARGASKRAVCHVW